MDIDQDGRMDIVSGSYSRMEQKMAGLFQVLHGKNGGAFGKAEVLHGTDGQPLIIPIKGEEEMTKNICTRQFVIDWNGDGKLDIVTGNFEGTFFWFKGEGKGKFAPKPEQIMAGAAPLKIKGAHSDPFIVDWDGDGDLDLVSGSSEASVSWAENTAGKGKLPTLKPFQTLIPQADLPKAGKTLREADLKRPVYGARVWVDDVNGDGKLDLLVGDNVTLCSPAKGVSDADMESKYSAWSTEFEAAMAAYSKATTAVRETKDAKAATGANKEAMTKAQKEYMKVYERRNQFMKEEMTGFVWLYLRK